MVLEDSWSTSPSSRAMKVDPQFLPKSRRARDLDMRSRFDIHPHQLDVCHPAKYNIHQAQYTRDRLAMATARPLHIVHIIHKADLKGHILRNHINDIQIRVHRGTYQNGAPGDRNTSLISIFFFHEVSAWDMYENTCLFNLLYDVTTDAPCGAHIHRSSY